MTVYANYVLDSLVAVMQDVEERAVRREVHDHATRHAGDLDVPHCRLAKTQSAFPIPALKWFNKLPPDLKVMRLAKFKDSVRTRLINRIIGRYTRSLSG